MHPILFQISFLKVYSYGAMLALAVLVCAYMLSRDAQKRGIAPNLIYDFVFWTVLGGIVGARIFYILITWDYYSANPLEVVMLHKGGLAWQGGFVGGVLSGFTFIRKHKLSVRQMVDLSAPYLALGQSIGRIGCFLNGCCYGKPWEQGLFFPSFGERLHPTQLYETAGLFLIFIILRAFQGKNQKPGMIFIYYLWLAAIERFVVEFFRADHEYLWLGLSLFQYVAIGIFVSGLIIFFRIARK